jgi:Putative Flp pilus-assembly TadE/G-like
LLSTIERRSEQAGQILVVFAGGLVAILLVAALVFDVGQNLLDRRTEQNVSDAAALAGARYVVGATYTYHGPCSGVTAGTRAPYEACQSAASNGYVDGANNITVRVDMPPIAPSAFSGLPGYIEVTIGSTRPSFFEGVIGIVRQRVGAMGVATNASDIALPYSLVALAPTACGANKITGSPGSAVSTNGTVHVDSSCPSDALLLSGNGVLNSPECDVVGHIQTSGGAVNNCTSAPSGVLVSGDPLRNLEAPAQPVAPAAVQPLDGGQIPIGCPGNVTPATDAAPAACAFTGGPVAGHKYRIFPGNYPGGIQASKATLYMDPGIYWIGGGGIQIRSSGANDGVIVSKAAGDNTGTTPSGGVLIYNTADPNAGVVAGCVSTPTGPGCYNDIVLNGGAGSTLALLPIQSGLYKNMVIFVDRTRSKPDDVDLDGSASTLSISGTIYAPSGTVKLNGSSSTSVSAQVICWSFQVNGSGASFTINYDGTKLFHLKGVGLVE